MSNRTKRGARRSKRLMLALAVVALAIVGCDDPTDPGEPGTQEPPPAGVASITVTPGSVALEIGDTVTLRAVLRSAQGDTLERAVTWASSNTGRATVSTSGLVTAKAAGTVTVTAMSGGRSGQAALTIAEPAPEPEAPTITTFDPAEAHAGGPPLTLRIFGTGFKADARVQWNGHSRPTEWVSETEVRAMLPADDVASIDTAEVRVVNPGDGKASDAAPFRIVAQPNPVAAVAVHPALAYTTVGSAVPLTATPRDGSGAPLTGRYVTYSSSNHLVASVDGNGLVRPVGTGEVTITVRSEGVETTSVVEVRSGEYHYLLMNRGPALATMDLRLGTAPGHIWQNWAGSRAIEPSPSPDGQFIAYVIEDSTTSSHPASFPRRMLAILAQTTRTYMFYPNLGIADQPAWSPAGDRIAFRGVVGDRTHILTVRPDGTGLVDLTTDLPAGSSAHDPAWSPDGSRIVFAVQSDPGFWGLMTMNSDGTGKRHLTSGAVDTQPVWIGDNVFFTRRDPYGAATDLWRVSVSGYGPLMPLTSTGTAHSPTPSPDHLWVAYVEGADQGPGAIMAVRYFGEDARPLFVPAVEDDGATGPVWMVHR